MVLTMKFAYMNKMQTAGARRPPLLRETDAPKEPFFVSVSPHLFYSESRFFIPDLLCHFKQRGTRKPW